MTLAETNIEAGQYELALQRIEWVLSQHPELEQALMLQEEALRVLDLMKVMRMITIMMNFQTVREYYGTNLFLRILTEHMLKHVFQP